MFSHGSPDPLVSTEVSLLGSPNGSLATGDVNGGGRVDLIHGYSNAGTFTLMDESEPLPADVRYVQAGDLDLFGSHETEPSWLYINE